MTRHHQEPDEIQKGPVAYPVNVARLPSKGMSVEIVADDAQRAELAADHGLLSVENYKADILVAPWKRNGIRVSGRVTADIVQECVVTLDPLPSHIDEEIEAVLLPDNSKLGRQGFDLGGEIVIDPDGADSPEVFSGDTIDVGSLAEQFFGLAIDPYPRKADAELPAEAEAKERGPLAEQLARLASNPAKR